MVARGIGERTGSEFSGCADLILSDSHSCYGVS